MAHHTVYLIKAPTTVCPRLHVARRRYILQIAEHQARNSLPYMIFLLGPSIAESTAATKAGLKGGYTMVNFAVNWTAASLMVSIIVGCGMRFGMTGWI